MGVSRWGDVEVESEALAALREIRMSGSVGVSIRCGGISQSEGVWR